MPDLVNLPRTIMPEEFFGLVREALADAAPPPGARDHSLGVHLTGAGGGHWHAGIAGGALVLGEGTVDAPLVALTLSVGDWREFVAGRVRDAVDQHVPVPLGDPKMITHLLSHTDRAELLQQFSGDIQVVVEDPEVDAEYRATCTLGGACPDLGAPTTTIRVALPDLVRLASGEDNPQAAFFQGKIRIDGDMNLAMGLMAAAMAG